MNAMNMKRIKEVVETKIVANPLASVGVAFAVGVLAGLRGGRAKETAGQRIFGAAVAGLAGLAVRAAKDYALREAADAAWKWWGRHRAGMTSTSEVRTSKEPSVETFLEH
jgi:hypothetical protein